MKRIVVAFMAGLAATVWATVAGIRFLERSFLP